MKKATKRNYTDKLRITYWTLWILDILILIIPALLYVIVALVNGQITVGQKFICSFAAVIALIISAVNLFLQKKKRSIIWIVLIGLYIAIKEMLLPLIIMLGAASIIDDFLLNPMIQHYRISLKSSKVYDKRKAEEAKFEQEGESNE